MFIKQITIEGVEGDVEILRIDGGVLVTSGNDIICEVRQDDPAERRWDKAAKVAGVVCGTRMNAATGRRVPNATDGMVRDVLNEIERVAGC